VLLLIEQFTVGTSVTVADTVTISFETSSRSKVEESMVAPLEDVTVVGWLPAVSSVPMTPAAVPLASWSPYVVPPVKAPTFETVIVSELLAPEPAVHVAVSADPH